MEDQFDISIKAIRLLILKESQHIKELKERDTKNNTYLLTYLNGMKNAYREAIGKIKAIQFEHYKHTKVITNDNG